MVHHFDWNPYYTQYHSEATLSSLTGHRDQGDVHDNWRRANAESIFKTGAIWECKGLVSVTRTITEWLLLEWIHGCRKIAVIGKSAVKIMPFQIAFDGKMTGSVDEGSAVGVIYLLFIRILDNPANIPVSEVECKDLDCWANGCVNNCWGDQAQL